MRKPQTKTIFFYFYFFIQKSLNLARKHILKNLVYIVTDVLQSIHVAGFWKCSNKTTTSIQVCNGLVAQQTQRRHYSVVTTSLSNVALTSPYSCDGNVFFATLLQRRDMVERRLDLKTTTLQRRHNVVCLLGDALLDPKCLANDQVF